MARPEKYIIDAVRALRGLGRKTFMENLTAYPRIERIYAVNYGSSPIAPYTPDVEHAGALLVSQVEIAHDQQYTEYFAVWETLPGPIISEVGYNDETLALEKVSRQKVVLPADPTALSTAADVDGWIVVDSTINPIDGITAERVTVSQKLPANYFETANYGFQFPAILFLIDPAWSVPNPPFTYTGPFPGVNYDLLLPRSNTNPALITHSYFISATKPTRDEIFSVYSPGAASKILDIPTNTIHPNIYFEEVNGADSQVVELIPESDPVSYSLGNGSTVQGDALLVACEVKRYRGNIWHKRTVTVSEGTFDAADHTEWPHYPECRDGTYP